MPRFDYKTKKNDRYKFNETHLILDGVLLEDSWVHKYEPRHSLSVQTDKSSRLLADLPLDELLAEFTSVHLNLLPPYTEYLQRLSINRGREEGATGQISFPLTVDFERWAQPYSIAELAAAIGSFVESEAPQGITYFQDDEFLMNGFGFSVPYDPAGNIQEIVEKWRSPITAVLNRVVEDLVSAAQRNSLVTLFDFPAPVRAACQQYLLYFVQFLRDLGIEADADIREQSHRVLFTVTPKSGPEALTQIREALETYLELPRDNHFNDAAKDANDVAVYQLQANVLHLKSQLALSQAILQTKDATIEALQMTNYNYQLLITGPRPPVNLDDPHSPEVEPLAGGLIEVTKLEGKGFKINLPEMLRRLKRRLE